MEAIWRCVSDELSVGNQRLHFSCLCVLRFQVQLIGYDLCERARKRERFNPQVMGVSLYVCVRERESERDRENGLWRPFNFTPCGGEE